MAKIVLEVETPNEKWLQNGDILVYDAVNKRFKFTHKNVYLSELKKDIVFLKNENVKFKEQIKKLSSILKGEITNED